MKDTVSPREKRKQDGSPKKKIGDVCFHYQKWKGQKRTLEGAPSHSEVIEDTHCATLLNRRILRCLFSNERNF